MCRPSAVNGVGMAIQRPFTFSRASVLAEGRVLTFTPQSLQTIAVQWPSMAGTQTERAHEMQDQPGESPAEYLDRYGRMRLIRRFEQEMHRLFLKGEVHGTTHLSAGQEAIPVGVCSALEPDDYAAGTYRGHGHALAKGTDPEALAAEMLGRATGVCGGRAGSMNVIDLEHGLVGCFGIVGGSIAAATGAAVSAQRQGKVAVAFFGDGASNQGYFHECLNWAQVFDLPVVFVCE